MTLWQAAQRAAAGVLLVVTGPLIVALALAIRVDTPGPAFFTGVRVGRGGAPFRIHKLRTMGWTPDAPGAAITSHADPRVTRIGRFIRQTHLDELPQLWDVVRGEMLLVGPRPEAPEYVDLQDDRWRRILAVRPGITGPTQLAFRDEARLLDHSDPDATYRSLLLPAKMESDLAYVERRTWRTDIEWLGRTWMSLRDGGPW